MKPQKVGVECRCEDIKLASLVLGKLGVLTLHRELS